MKKILLTGGNGFFCSRFTNKYKNTFEILSTDVPELDITNAEAVMQTFESFKPDYVIHAAAIASTEFCNNHPEKAYDVNVNGAVNVAKACKKTGAKLIFISSEQVFNGNTERGPYTEEHTPVPNTMYGKNKLEAEGILRGILDELWVLRFTWLFGIPERLCGMSPNILWNTISLALKGEKTPTTCNEYRGLTYAYEVINQFPQIFEIPYGTYHVGSHNDFSRYDISCFILKELGLEDRIPELIEKDEEKYKDCVRDVRLCTDKIRQHGLSFSDTKEGIQKCIKEFGIKL